MIASDKHPEVGERVKILYFNKVNKREATFVGKWDGERWLIKAPYTKNNYLPVPLHLEVIAWEKE